MLLQKRGRSDVQRRYEDRQLPRVLAGQLSSLVEHPDRVLPWTIDETGQR